MADTIDILKELARKIRYATLEGENSGERVGRTLIGILNLISQLSRKELETVFLRKDKNDRTDHSLEIGGNLTVEGLLKALDGISVGDKGSITSDGIATLQILKALVMAEVKALSVSGAASVGSLDSEGNISTGTDVLAKGTVHSLNSVVQALSRTHDLTVEQTADIMHQIIHEYISSNKFVSGFLGEGFKVWKDDAGLWHGELDMLTVRKVFTVFELMVQKVVHQGGMAIRSAAGGKITKVTDGGSYWRCEHDSTDDFVANDQVLCQVFTGTKMKRYWRLVTSAGAGYFNLSKTDCEAGSAIPEAGDDVAVLGNRSNTARQKAQIDCAVGVDAPYRDDYAGINSYSLSGKLVTRTGNLTGITDDDFGPLSGSGLYGRNVYLKGVFRLLSGKTVDGALEELKGRVMLPGILPMRLPGLLQSSERNFLQFPAKSRQPSMKQNSTRIRARPIKRMPRWRSLNHIPIRR